MRTYCIAVVVALAVLVGSGCACYSVPAAPGTPKVELPTVHAPGIARCERPGGEGTPTTCWDEEGFQVTEDSPYWDCSTMGNMVCGEPQVHTQ